MKILGSIGSTMVDALVEEAEGRNPLNLEFKGLMKAYILNLTDRARGDVAKAEKFAGVDAGDFGIMIERFGLHGEVEKIRREHAGAAE